MTKVTFISTQVGSPLLKKVKLLSTVQVVIVYQIYSQLVAESRSTVGREGVSMAPEVSQLVDYVWAEANGQLDEVLASPVETIKTEQVEKAEASLMSLKRHLMKADPAQTDPENERVKLETEFYGCLPHKHPHRVAIDSMRVIAQKQDLCQVCTIGLYQWITSMWFHSLYSL